MRRRAVLVRVLAACSRPVIPLGRERTPERGHSLTNPVRCLSQAPNMRRSAQQTLALCEREASRSHILSHIRVQICPLE